MPFLGGNFVKIYGQACKYDAYVVGSGEVLEERPWSFHGL